MPSQHVELPSGGWADLRDPDTIKAKDRKKVLLSLDDVRGAMAEQMQAGEMVMALAVEKWSFDLPVPIEDLDSLGELSIPDHDALATAAKPIHDILFPSFADDDDGDDRDADPADPPEPSNT